jgi:DNA-binding transcriptional LysR family regulator
VEIVREIDSLADAVRDADNFIRPRTSPDESRTFGDAPIGQALVDFVRAHPGIVIDVRLDDRFVDLVEEGFDLAIRITRLENSSLIARKLRPFDLELCASPALIAERGPLAHPGDLANHPCIVDTNGRGLGNWLFQEPGGRNFTVSVSGPIEVNSPFAVRAAAVAGLGFAILPDFVAAPALASGRLVTLFDEWMPQGGGIYAVYPHRRYLPAKVRALVDFLARWFKEHADAAA